jgi:asparagine synthase (glutamine-hydrolysing)
LSGLYLTTQTTDDLAPVARGLAFTRTTESTSCCEDILAGVVTRVDRLDYWGPAQDQASGVRVFLGGRVALDASTWAAAADLPFDGGTTAKAILSAWLERSERIADWLNGAFAVAILDSRGRRLHLFTDRMGSYPVYQATLGPLRLCSHPDVLADALTRAGSQPSLDLKTLAELLATGRSVHPYTYYREIRQLDAGTHYLWRLDHPEQEPTRREYWYPAYRDRHPPRRYQPELVEELATAWRQAVRLRTHVFFGKPGVLLSGGADSRGMLFALEDRTHAACITFYDEPNPELATARRLASAAGAEHQAWQRDPEFYGASAAETVRISGGMWSLAHGHPTGFLHRLDGLGLGTLMTGCCADWMFKGLSFNRQAPGILRWKLPVTRLARFAHEHYVPHYSLRAPWQAAIVQRLDSQVEGIHTTHYRDTALLVEERRLRPTARTIATAFRLILLRCTPWDWVFADNSILRVYGRMSIESKLTGLVFRRAVARLCGSRAAAIRNTNNATRLDEGPLEWFTAGLRRKTRRAFGLDYSTTIGVAGQGSWINHRWYVANSPVLRDLWSAPSSSERDLFTGYLGYDPWTLTMWQWSEKEPLFYQLLTARLWLNQRRLI